MGAGDWIKLGNGLRNSPLLARMARAMDVPTASALGVMAWIWMLADEEADVDKNGDGILPYAAEDLDALLGVDGVVAAAPDRWLVDEGDQIRLPGYVRHNGQTTKRRIADARRKKSKTEPLPQSHGGNSADTPQRAEHPPQRAESLRSECGASADQEPEPEPEPEPESRTKNPEGEEEAARARTHASAHAGARTREGPSADPAPPPAQGSPPPASLDESSGEKPGTTAARDPVAESFEASYVPPSSPPTKARWRVQQSTDGRGELVGLTDPQREKLETRFSELDLEGMIGDWTAHILAKEALGQTRPSNLELSLWRWCEVEQRKFDEGTSRHAKVSSVELAAGAPNARLAQHRIDLGEGYGSWPIDRRGWDEAEDGDHFWIDRKLREAGERFYIDRDGWMRASGACNGVTPGRLRRATLEEIFGHFAPNDPAEVAHIARILRERQPERAQSLLLRFGWSEPASEPRDSVNASQRHTGARERTAEEGDSASKRASSKPRPIRDVLDSLIG